MAIISKNYECSGIYCILNLNNNKRYIGSSNNIRKRLWKHRSLLRHCKHENDKLQNSWNKHGEDCFEFSILETCAMEFLLEREQYYLDTLHPEYNIAPSTTNQYQAQTSINKMKKTIRKQIDSGNRNFSWKEVHQYDLNGNYIKTFKSRTDACKEVGMHSTTLERHLAGKFGMAGGFIWTNEKKDNVPPFVKKRKHKKFKKVLVFNDTERYIFDKAQDCATHFGVHLVSVRGAIINNRRFLNKYTIKYL